MHIFVFVFVLSFVGSWELGGGWWIFNDAFGASFLHGFIYSISVIIENPESRNQKPESKIQDEKKHETSKDFLSGFYFFYSKEPQQQNTNKNTQDSKLEP